MPAPCRAGRGGADRRRACAAEMYCGPSILCVGASQANPATITQFTNSRHGPVSIRLKRSRPAKDARICPFTSKFANPADDNVYNDSARRDWAATEKDA